MTVKPPSDIVLDVARAADPARVTAAVQKLDSAATSGFDAALSATGDGPGAANSWQLRGRGMLTGTGLSSRTDQPGADGAEAKSFRKIEAFFLQTMLQTMMPANANSVFGKGTAGSVWRSMLSEQIANQVTSSGGLGIASRLLEAQQKIDAARAAAVAAPASTEGGAG